MQPLVFAIALLHVLVLVPGLAVAAVKVTISDGVTTRSASFTGFTLSAATSAGTTTTLNILSSSPRFFPSGATTQQSGDSFRIENVSSSNLFRCLKTDSTTVGSPQLLEVKGLKATATSTVGTTGRRLTVTCETESGNFRSLSSSSGTYAAKAALKGEVRASTSLTSNRNVAQACVPAAFFTSGTPTVDSATLTAPCLRVELRINDLALNGQGSSTLLTASIPCSATLDINGDGVADGPCGPSGTGTWNPALAAGDQLNAIDQGTVGCGTTCNPIFKVTVTAGPLRFRASTSSSTVQGEFVRLTNSASVGMADLGLENFAGRENLEFALASETGTNTWIGYCGNVAPTRVVPQPPLTNGTRNAGPANIPLKFLQEKASLVPVGPEGFTMESVGQGDAGLPPDQRASNDACYQIHIPPPGGLFKNVTDATLHYTFVEGTQTSSYPSLKTTSLDYTDCVDACFRAYISLQDRFGVFKGRLVVYLGNSPDFRAGHDGFCCSGINLAGLADARVDPSGMLGNPQQTCCMTFADAQSPGKFGNLTVRAFVVVLDQGLDGSDPAANHRVVLQNASFNGSEANGTEPGQQFLQIVGPYAPSCDWPALEGLRMVIFKRPDLTTPVQVITNLTIDAECQLRGDATVSALNPTPGGSTYEVWIQHDAPPGATHGTSLPDVGVMTIFAL
jgi:hypothetical protein